jgi:hypothetical protein
MEVCCTAISTLTVIVTRFVATSSSQPFDWEKLAVAGIVSVQQERKEDVQRAGWGLLASVVPAQPSRDWFVLSSPLLHTSLNWFLSHRSFALSLLQQTSDTPHPTATLEAAQTAFIVSLICLPPVSPPFPFLPTASALLARALKSPTPSVRLRACEALSSPSLFSPSPILPLDPWQSALSLSSSEPEAAVRAAAVRVLGLLVKSEAALAAEERLAAQAAVMLLRRLGEGTNEANDDEAGLSWALANCCDALVSRCVMCSSPPSPQKYLTLSFYTATSSKLTQSSSRTVQ